MRTTRKILAERRAARAEKAKLDAELLELHRLVIAALEREGAAGPIRSAALSKVDLWEEKGAASEDYIVRWRALLAMPADEMAAEVLRLDGWGPALRQATPFGAFYRDRTPFQAPTDGGDTD